ncbi:hypothetical protein Tco_0989352 [Tanacetum coccineum]|uniref:Tf2-1-like SH3-like domain-containing protein n=1 Tax=Tanacetum coccineum TaxID=301880 RepID=A0ABQ5ETE8_9ASTR
MSTSTQEAFNWTSKDEEAIQEIKLRKKQSPSTNFLYKSTIARIGNLLYPYRKGIVSIDLHNEEQEKNNKGTFRPKEKPQEELTPIQGPRDYTLEESPTKMLRGRNGSGRSRRKIWSFDVIVGMDRLSKRKFAKVCHEKVVRIPLEGDGILRVHGERTQGVVKTLMNAKVDELKLSDISVVRDFIDVFPEDLSMTTAMTKEEHGVHLKLVLELLRNEKLCVKVEKGRIKPRRFRAVAMTIQYGVSGMILAVQSEAFKKENILTERIHGSPVLWVEIGESSLTGLELVQETTDKVVLVKEKPISGPFEFLERIGLVADRLRLPEELSCVHDTFHVSNLEKKCLADASLHVSLDEIKVDKTLRFVKEPVENSDP